MIGEIKLVRHRGINIATGREEDLPQSYVTLNGKSIGYIGDAEGARVMLIRRFPEGQRREIEARVAELRGVESIGSAQPPEEKERPKESGATDDDLDS